MTAADTALAAAMREIGKPYVYGAEGPNSFDCSGLIQFVYAAAGIKTPRTSQDQQRWAQPVSNPLPGDLVFYGGTGGRADHVGLYVGGGKMIAAPQPGDKVKLQAVYGTPSSYGRVPGAGTAAAPILGTIGAGFETVSKAASGVGDWLGGARYMVVELAFIGLGVGLLWAGGYQGVSRSFNRAKETVIPI